MGGGTATWAEYYLGDAQRLVPVPDSIDDATACQLISMPLSAKMLLADLDVKAGDWIIQNAANGAVGKLINQFAAEVGVKVVNLVRREAGVKELQAAGILNAVSTSTENWRDEVVKITGGAPIVRGLDSVGGTGPEALLSVAAERAEIISFGNLTGEKITLSSANLLFKQATLRGYWAARTRLAPEVIGKMIGELVTAAATGKLKLSTDASYDLADAAEAARASLTPGRSGKITLKA
jgi:NADPH:quinone reductase-like Zn-dependent oxidoreductase